MGEPEHKLINRTGRSDEDKRLVTCLNKLLMMNDTDSLLAFLHQMKIQFSLSTDGKGKYRCRVFQHWYDEDRLLRVVEWDSTGNSGKSALCNSIADFLAVEGDDFHAFINRGWPDL